MNGNIFRDKHFMFSPQQRKFPNNNILYKNYATNRNNLLQKNKNIEGYGIINNDNSYSNFHKTMRYNNNILNQLNQTNEEKDFNNNIYSLIESLNNENLSLKTIVKNIKKELNQRDNEIDIYKIKVKALLGQVQDKNIDLNKKRNIIIKLNEEKEINSMTPTQNSSNSLNQTNYNLIKKQLDIANREKDKLFKEKKYLEKIIQKFRNLNKKNYKNNNFSPSHRVENEKSNDFDNYKNNNIYENNNSNYLIIGSFYFSIEGGKKEDDDLLLEKELQINKLNKMIEELKKNCDFQLNKYKLQLEENKILLKNKENIINDLSNNIKALKEENVLLKNELNEKMNEINDLNIKNCVLNTDKDDLTINDHLISNFEKDNEFDEKVKVIEELKNQNINIENEKVNLERRIEELNEEIENFKEMNEYNKKELNEKNNIINELKKDNNKLYSDNTDLKKRLNKANENLDNLNEEIEKEKNKNEQLTNDKKELLDKIILSQKEIENMKKENSDLTEQITKYQNKNNYDLENNQKNSIFNTLKRKSQLKEDSMNNIKENEEEEYKTGNSNEINNNKNQEISHDTEFKKENEILQQKIIQLNENNEDLTNQLNNINIKYQKLKNENNNLKEVSHALLEKQKNDLEQKDKNERISPETHFIILKKSYKKLNWYLISTVSPKSKNENDINKYENYKWVTELIIPKTQLNKYNKFEDEKETLNLNSLNKKIKIKEDSRSEKDKEIGKLSNQLQNKTASMNLKGGIFLLNKLNNDKNNNVNKSNSNQNYTNKFNANSCLGGEAGGDVEKYKNILDKLNDYGEREIKLQNEISKLRNQLKNNQNLQSGLNNIKDISQHFLESEFLEDDKDNKNVLDLLSNIKKNEKEERKIRDEDNFLNILNDVPGNDSDLDEVKGLKKLINYLKNEIKEKERILNELIEQIKELFKELKWSTKNSQRVSQILNILGYTPEIIKIIVDNKKGYNFDFNLKLKK